MRVTLVAAASSTAGGGEKHVLDLTQALPGRGREVTLVCPPGGDLPARAASAGARVVLLDVASAQPAQLRALARLLSASRADVVHAHGSRAAFVTRLADHEAASRCVYTLHGIHVDRAGSSLRRTAFVRVERALRRRTARFITVCEADAVRGAALGVLTPSLTSVVHNGIGPQAPGDPLGFVGEVQAALGGRRRGPLVLTVGRVHLQKDHGSLLGAWRRVVARRPDAALAIVGDGPLRDALAERIRRDGLEDSVALLPPRRDLAPAYAASDLFVLSSRWEGLPYVVLEAMACRLPVVATAVDGIPEAVSDGVTGILVPPGSPEALATALVRSLDDPDARALMGAAGLERVEREFSLDGMVRGVCRVYDTVGRRGPHRPG
jgi:glycosyltransferase involved in cell wall biosynthesis